jgi:RNA polymerase sigma factor (sigma-70 family)
MKGAMVPGNEPDQPRGRFDPDTFYLEHLAELLRFFQRTARRLGIDAGEDTLQDVWIKLRDNHDKIDTSEPRIVIAWCKKAGANHLLDLIRGGYHSYEEPHSNLAIIDAERVLGTTNNPEQQWADRADLRRSLIDMPDKLAEVFLLAADGYSNVEIAEMLGITATAARTRLARARAYARHRLGAFVARLVPIGPLAHLTRTVRRQLGRPSQLLVTGIGSLSVVLVFGVPVVPGTVSLPSSNAQGVVVRAILPGAGRPSARMSPGRTRAVHKTPAVTPAAGRRAGNTATPGLVPRVPKTCAPHLCVSSACPDSHETGDRVYLKPTNDPCGVEVTESYTPVCPYVTDNPIVGCHRDGDPQWVVNPPPSPNSKGGPL